MKKILFILLFLPYVLFSQEINEKYAPGKVKTENGLVVFNKTIEAEGKTKAEIYTQVFKWAVDRFKTQGDTESHVQNVNTKGGVISCNGQQYLVFKNKPMVKDQTLINYRMDLRFEDNKCEAQVLAIRYVYNRENIKEMHKAEETITDKFSFTKKGKPNRYNYKFRTHTIDMVETLFENLKKAL